MKFEPLNIRLKNGKTVQIRQGIESDAGELIHRMKEIFGETEYLLVDEDEFNMTLEQETAWLKAFDDVPTSLYLAAVYNDKIIGTCGIVGNVMKKMKHTASIGISLLKEWQNQGLGKKLMEESIGWAKKNTDLEIIWLDVFSTNTHAVSLYKKLGFVEEGRQKNFVRLKSGYCDKITMSLDIRQ